MRRLLVVAAAISALPHPLVAADGTTQTAAYKVVEQWTVPNGGYGRVIVIDPKLRTEAGLRAVAEKLRQDTAADRNAFVTIYDDLRAARLRKAADADKLSPAQGKLYDAHALGSYIRNGNTGAHELNMFLQGLNGPMKKIVLH
jgi:hypothetical protein